MVGRGREVGRVVQQELLRGVGVAGELGDDPVVHHVLRGDRGLGAAQRGHEERVGGDLGVLVLGGAVGRDGVEDVGHLPSDQALVVARRVPGEHFRGHGSAVEPLHELDRCDGLR